jgi:hypothetical protein
VLIVCLLHDDQVGEPDPVADSFLIDQYVPNAEFERRGFTVLLSTTTN